MENFNSVLKILSETIHNSSFSVWINRMLDFSQLLFFYNHTQERHIEILQINKKNFLTRYPLKTVKNSKNIFDKICFFI